MSEVKGVECTASFRGIDGLGTCDTRCQWYIKPDTCPCGKGTKAWDGEGEERKEPPMDEETAGDREYHRRVDEGEK